GGTVRARPPSVRTLPAMPEPRDVSALRCTLLVLRCADIDASRAFYEALGAHFVEAKHGEGPRHYAATLGGITHELYQGEADVGSTRDYRDGRARGTQHIRRLRSRDGGGDEAIEGRSITELALLVVAPANYLA